MLTNVSGGGVESTRRLNNRCVFAIYNYHKIIIIIYHFLLL